MAFERSSGLLLHPTSLPSPDGIGDLGPEAYRWVDFIAESGCTYWQILPLNPTGYGDSPYQCFSAFAGNPYMVSPVLLVDEGLLTLEDLQDRPAFPNDKVDFGPVIQWKKTLLHRSYLQFTASAKKHLRDEFTQFRHDHSHWLDDYAVFSALKDYHGGRSWVEWEEAYRSREPRAISDFCSSNSASIVEITYWQFLLPF